MPPEVTIYTDGACSGNPGPGGWAAILIYGRHQREISGGEPHTTNNRMELTAAIEGLRALNKPCEVNVVTDSEYVKNGITEWIHNWRKRDFGRRGGKLIKNAELWEELDREAARHKTKWSWTRGHSHDALNNRCDELARAQIERIRKWGGL